MQQKLCLWLAVAVLFGALVAGNPFLAGTSRRLERRPDAPMAPARPVVGSPVVGDAVIRDAGIRDAGIGEVAPRVPAMDARVAGSRRFEATPAFAVALNAPAPAEASAAPPCPDRALRPLVVCVERNERGEPVWVLRDGSRCMRNPKRGVGQPLLIPFPSNASK